MLSDVRALYQHRSVLTVVTVVKKQQRPQLLLIMLGLIIEARVTLAKTHSNVYYKQDRAKPNAWLMR